MEKIRVIARLDVKPPYVIKPVHFEGLRKVGKPEELAARYYRQGADEIFYIDCVASLYQREIYYEFIKQAADNIFVPFCVGGGIRSVDDVAKLIRSGADKVVMNTHAVNNPQLVRESAQMFGSQCVVVSIEAKKHDGWWECYTDCGRIPTGKDALVWAKEAQELGAGEILITSVDHEGRRRGFDIALTQALAAQASVPVVASGGAGNLEDIARVLKEGRADAVALASVLHYDILTIRAIKEAVKKQGFEVYL